MGLLTTWGASNKVINSSKIVTYTQQKLYGQSYESYGWNYDKIWNYERHCTMNFEYVGMDLATAKSCVASMITTFTRPTKVSVWNKFWSRFVDTNTGSTLMSDISIQKMSGGMYKVVVSVNETDARSTVNPTSSVVSLFATENARDYLEDEQ